MIVSIFTIHSLSNRLLFLLDYVSQVEDFLANRSAVPLGDAVYRRPIAGDEDGDDGGDVFGGDGRSQASHQYSQVCSTSFQSHSQVLMLSRDVQFYFPFSFLVTDILSIVLLTDRRVAARLVRAPRRRSVRPTTCSALAAALRPPVVRSAAHLPASVVVPAEVQVEVRVPMVAEVASAPVFVRRR